MERIGHIFVWLCGGDCLLRCNMMKAVVPNDYDYYGILKKILLVISQNSCLLIFF